MLSEQEVKQAVESNGYSADSVTLITEGRSHDNFRIRSTSGALMIARFEKQSDIFSHGGMRRDPNFNGPLSLIRERNSIDIVRDEAGLPAPKIYGLYESESAPFLLVEQLSGIYWSDFLKDNNFSLEAYLHSLRYLGRDLGKALKVKFDSYGDVVDRHEVYPGTISNFTDRVQMITDLKITRAQEAEILRDKEFDDIKEYIQTEMVGVSEALIDSPKPGLVLTDIHPMNFLIDEKGEPSGYFDLEACQAGHPSLTLYDLRRGLFSYFNGVAERAEESFLSGYEENGEGYNPDDLTNQKLERVLIIGYLLGATTLYHNVKDGVRDSWSDQYKQIMLEAIQKGRANYTAIGDVTRFKTGQPKFPN